MIEQERLSGIQFIIHATAMFLLTFDGEKNVVALIVVCIVDESLILANHDNLIVNCINRCILVVRILVRHRVSYFLRR